MEELQDAHAERVRNIQDKSMDMLKIFRMKMSQTKRHEGLYLIC